MNITQASPRDAGILATIVHQANGPVADRFGLTRDNAPTHPAFCTPDWILAGMGRGEEYYLARTGEGLKGCVAYESAGPDLAFLNRLAVVPRAQGRGLGTALVGQVEMMARARGKQKISIGIIKAHSRLRDWYAGRGFEPAGTKDFDHLPFEVLFMHLTLK